MKVDYHLHPNLRGRNQAKRLRKLWNAIAEHHLDAVICAEHSFKNAPDAYRKLIASKPEGLRTHVFPGAELVAKDATGIDVIAFAEHDWYDDHPLLLEPYAMSLKQMLSYLENSDLQYFIPHPLIPTSPLKTLFGTGKKMQAFLASVPAFEAFNGCWLLFEHLCSFPMLRPVLRRTRNNLRRNARLPLQMYLHPSHQFIAVGSDAHYPSEVGFCVDIPFTRLHCRSSVFQRITSNTDIQTIHFPRFHRALLRLLLMAWTTINEGRMRKEWRLYQALQEKILLQARGQEKDLVASESHY
jgi:hypothetical protein